MYYSFTLIFVSSLPLLLQFNTLAFFLFIYRRFVCGYPWCVSYPALPSGCRNIVAKLWSTIKISSFVPCFEYEFCSSFLVSRFFASARFHSFVPPLVSHWPNKVHVSGSSPRFTIGHARLRLFLWLTCQAFRRFGRSLSVYPRALGGALFLSSREISIWRRIIVTKQSERKGTKRR